MRQLFQSKSWITAPVCGKLIDLHASLRLLSDTQMTGAAKNASTNLGLSKALRWMLAALLLVSCAVSLHAGIAKTLKHEKRHEIDRLEEAWRIAVLNRDPVAMDALLADDYMGINARGVLLTREQALANLRSGQMHITSLNISDRKVRFYGATAVITSLAAVDGTKGAEDISGSFRYTLVCVRNPGGAWKIVSFEANRIRGQGEHK
jgi:ketosteroid isomerase-like protein